MKMGSASPLPPTAQRALYFESATPAAVDAPRILLISYNFPPDPAVGGLRWQQMARIFAASGWAVDVLARDFSDVSGLDRARLERLSTGIRIFCILDREPLVGRAQNIIWPPLRRLLGRHVPNSVIDARSTADALTQQEIFQQRGPRTIVRAYLAWMEFARHKMWALAVSGIGIRMARSARYVCVISSGPPHIAHEAGRRISEATRLPHVVDMRDPWSLVQRLREAIASPVWVRLARRYERNAVANAALITMNTETACDAMRAAYPEAAEKIAFVRNGSDDEPLPSPQTAQGFRVRFAGSIYMDRDPRPFFKAAKQVITKLGLTPERFMIELVGHANRYANTPTINIAEEEGITAYLRIGGRQQRQQVMEFLAGASVLLSLPQDSDYAVPAKIYEYVRFHAWMLVLASPGSATERVLRDTDADIVDPSDVAGIAQVLQHRYEQFASGIRPEPIGRDGRFDRALQAKKMMDLIVARCRPGGPAGAQAPGVSAPPTPLSLAANRRTPI